MPRPRGGPQGKAKLPPAKGGGFISAWIGETGGASLENAYRKMRIHAFSGLKNIQSDMALSLACLNTVFFEYHHYS